MAINKEADFIMKDGRAIYPPVISDESLKLWYDTKGKKNSDRYKDKMFDMSGNKNHGTLENFDYKNLSGYQEDSQLVFDGIDDTLTMPKLNGIDANNFTYQLNNNILAFTGDEIKTVKDDGIEVVGRNLISDTGGTFELVKTNSASYRDVITRTTNVIPTDKEYILSFKAKASSPMTLQSHFYNPNTTTRTETSTGSVGTVNDGTARTKIGTEWDSYWIKWTQNEASEPKSVIVARILNEFTNIILEMKEIKLEKGNTVTDWTPAPEDLIETTDLKGNILGDMEDIIDDHTRDEQSGLEVFTDKADDSLVRVDVDGRSCQIGDNILDLADLRSYDNYNTTPVKIDDNTVSTTFVGSVNYLTIRRDKLKTNGEVLVSGYLKLNGRPITNSDFPYKSIDTNATVKSFGIDDNTGYIETVMDWTNSRSDWMFHTPINGAKSGDVITIEQFSVVPLNPSPDYPVEIHSLNDFDVVSSVGKRNYVQNNNNTPLTLSMPSRGYTFSEYSIDLSPRYPKVGDKYFISTDIENGSGITGNGLYLRDFTNGYNGGNSNHSPQEKIGNINTISQSNVDELVIVFRAQGSAESTATAKNIYAVNLTEHFGEGNEPSLDWCQKNLRYTPNLQDITENDSHPFIDKINISLSEPLRSVGDVKDRLFRDSDGLWKVERSLAEGYADGSENWTRHSTFNRFDATTHFLPISGANTLSSPSYNTINSHYSFDGVANSQTSYSTWVVGRTPRIVHGEMTSVSELKSFIKSEYDKGTPVTWVYQIEPYTEILPDELQDKLNNLRSFQDSNYVYAIINEADDLPSHIAENLKPTLHARFLAEDWYKENLMINSLKIYDRALEPHEMMLNYDIEKKRFPMGTPYQTNPITQTINLTQGGYVANTLSLEYTIEI